MSGASKQAERFCELTCEYLHWMVYRVCDDHTEAENVIKSYTKPGHEIGDLDICGIYKHFCSHACSKSHGGPAIVKVFGNGQKQIDWDKLGDLLGQFNPAYVCETYPQVDMLHQAIVTSYRLTDVTKPVRDYIITMFELAHFLNRYRNSDEFYGFLNTGYKENRSQLIRTLMKEEGICKNAFFQMGHSLIRVSLKEMGYTNYVKPDLHIKDISSRLGLVPERTGDEHIAEVLEEIALQGGITPYQLDKFLFLIGSGNFYNHNQGGDERWGQLSRQDSVKRKIEFAEFIKDQLESPPLKAGDRIALLATDYSEEGLRRGQLGQIHEIQPHFLIKVAFTGDQGMVREKTLFPAEFVVLRGWG